MKGHVLVCFLAHVLWTTIGQMCKRAGLGDEPRKVFEEIAQIKVVDVILPTKQGIEIRKSCVTLPTEAQDVLLQRLGLSVPKYLEKMKVM